MNRVRLKAGRRQWVFLQAKDNWFNYTHFKKLESLLRNTPLQAFIFKT